MEPQVENATPHTDQGWSASVNVDDIPKTHSSDPARRCRELATALEQGKLLFFPRTPIDIPGEDLEFLLAQRQHKHSYHKNIAYRPAQDRVTGYTRGEVDADRLFRVLKAYCHSVAEALGRLLPTYAEQWKLDYANFRPAREESREAHRSDVMHVDAFDSRPTNGALILRLFTNINLKEVRQWATSDPFPVTVDRLVGTRDLPLPKPQGSSVVDRARLGALQLARRVGLPIVARSAYDEFMLRMNKQMKKNRHFQDTCPRYLSDFPPGSSWLVFADMVPHMVLRGQYALDQTFFVPRSALTSTDSAPASVLEKLCGGRLTFAPTA